MSDDETSIHISESMGHPTYFANCCSRCKRVLKRQLEKVFSCLNGYFPNPVQCFVCGHETTRVISGRVYEWIDIEKYIQFLKQELEEYKQKNVSIQKKVARIMQIIDQIKGEYYWFDELCEYVEKIPNLKEIDDNGNGKRAL